MEPRRTNRHYRTPVLRDLGRMGVVTKKSFAKGGNKMDPGLHDWARANKR